MKEIKLALLGYGNAGRAFGKLLCDKNPEIRKAFDVEVKVTAIATKTRGTLIQPKGLSITALSKELSNYGKFENGTEMSALEVAETADYDLLVEMTPLDIFSGQPAISHIKAAIGRGKHVITANKGPIAWAYDELSEMAKEKGSLFLHEATVMDGTPVFNLAADTLKMCRVQKIEGILNTTTNFILEELAKGADYEKAIEEGRRRGFVEADPSLDTEGWDAAAKLCALMNVLMEAKITPPEIKRQGIEGITAERLKEAADRGYTIKLLCTGSIENGKAEGRVEPAEIRNREIFASIGGTTSAVSLTTDLMGTLTIVEHSPEIEQTAYGIFSDLLRVLERI